MKIVQSNFFRIVNLSLSRKLLSHWRHNEMSKITKITIFDKKSKKAQTRIKAIY